MDNWLTVKDYADLNEITTQAVYKRIKNGTITEDRIRFKEGTTIKQIKMVYKCNELQQVMTWQYTGKLDKPLNTLGI